MGANPYDWTQETWEKLGVLGTSVLAGAGCAAIAAPAGPVLAGAAFAICAGGVGGGLNAYAAGGDIGQVFGGVITGTVVGGFSFIAGAGLSGAASWISSNPYFQATVATATTAGTNIGLQALSGNDIDWGQVAVQTAISGVQAFYRASQVDAGSKGRGRLDMSPDEVRAACKGLCPAPGSALIADKSTLAGAEYSITRAIHEGRLQHAAEIAQRVFGVSPTGSVPRESSQQNGRNVLPDVERQRDLQNYVRPTGLRRGVSFADEHSLP